jgi:hypothetical protein
MTPPMDNPAASTRAPAFDDFSKWLGRPVAFAITTLILLAVFGATFVTNPDRVAPTKDPAYYTWRTDALIQEEPVTLLEIEGALGMFEGGYRVTAPVIGGYLRDVAGIGTLRVTVVLMVVLPVMLALLLAGFAFRQYRDPLMWHLVALGSGSLLLTPPFVGYLDNVLCLVFMAASLFFIAPAKNSWPARVALFSFLFAAGLTHPTTLVIFCAVLGMMAAVKLVFRKFDLRSVIADDAPMLLTAFASAVATVALWTLGIWGKSASLSESALSPPYGSDFFVDRLVLWVKAMTPVLNGPLLVVGIIGLFALFGRRSAEEELARVSIVWLAPLVGIFGFLAGKAYPYYRFFNTTLSWVLLIGIGMFFVARYLIGVSARGGAAKLALIGLVGIAAIIFSNFTKGLDLSGWNNADGGWLSTSERTQLDSVRAAAESHEGRPFVFVIDDEPPRDFQIWGFSKLSGNTSRYGMPEGEIENAYLYLGSLENALAGQPTLRGQETYDMLSPALLEDAEAGIERAGAEPIFVVAQAFNPAGENVGIVTGDAEVPSDGAEVWVVSSDGVITSGGQEIGGYEAPEEGGIVDILIALLGFLLLLLPGYLALRFVLPSAGVAEGVGLVPALSITLLSLVGIVVLAVVRAPFTTPVALACVALSSLLAWFAGTRWQERPAASPAQP